MSDFLTREAEKSAMVQKAKMMDELMKKQEIVNAYNQGGQDVSVQAAQMYANDLTNGLAGQHQGSRYGLKYPSANDIAFYGADGVDVVKGYNDAVKTAAVDEATYIDSAVKGNKDYNTNKEIVKRGNSLKYPSTADIAFYGKDGVDLVGEYYANKAEIDAAKEALKKYESNIDPKVASQWQSSYTPTQSSPSKESLATYMANNLPVSESAPSGVNPEGLSYEMAKRMGLVR